MTGLILGTTKQISYIKFYILNNEQTPIKALEQYGFHDVARQHKFTYTASPHKDQLTLQFTMSTDSLKDISPKVDILYRLDDIEKTAQKFFASEQGKKYAKSRFGQGVDVVTIDSFVDETPSRANSFVLGKYARLPEELHTASLKSNHFKEQKITPKNIFYKVPANVGTKTLQEDACFVNLTVRTKNSTHHLKVKLTQNFRPYY